MQPLKKKKLPRVERNEVIEVHDDENAHLWAVSYSDFLMALLSFFILFFSVDTPDKRKIIMNLTQEFSKQNGGGMKNGDAVDGEARLPANIFDAVKTLQVKVDKDREILVVNFPDDIFRPGERNMNQTRRELMDHFLDIVKPYRGQVNLYFEGHTDSSPLKIHKSDIITDNFVLSSLRASAALRMAQDAGFPEKNLFIQADSANTRNSRSLSIRVEPRKETL